MPDSLLHVTTHPAGKSDVSKTNLIPYQVIFFLVFLETDLLSKHFSNVWRNGYRNPAQFLPGLSRFSGKTQLMLRLGSCLEWQLVLERKRWISVPRFTVSGLASSLEDIFFRYFLSSHASCMSVLCFSLLQHYRLYEFMFYSTREEIVIGTEVSNVGQNHLAHLNPAWLKATSGHDC